MTLLILTISLGIFLPVVVLLHRLGQWQAERRAGHPVPTQGVALKAVLGGIFLTVSGLGLACWRGGMPVAWGIWAAVILCGLGYCYWSLICLTESGRRYMIAELVAANPGITASQIITRYNRQQIITVRLDRLEHWGSLARKADRYKPHPTLMLIASVLVQRWALLLGFAWARSFSPAENKPNSSSR